MPGARREGVGAEAGMRSAEEREDPRGTEAASRNRSATEMPTKSGGLGHGFDRGNVLALAGAHFAHDTYPAFLGVMLPLLIPKLGISLATAGVIASGVRWTTSAQPLLGYWADRLDTRSWVIVAPTTTALCMSLVGIAPNEAVLLVLLLLTGLSHAAFHPAGGALTTQVAGDQWGKGSSYFMAGGELGRMVGPLYIAAILGAVGLERSWIAFFPGFAASLLLYRRFGRRGASLHIKGNVPASMRAALRAGRQPLAMLSVAIMVRAWVNISVIVYYPTFATGRGFSLLVAGLSLTVYETGAVAGTFAGGLLSDRYGRRRMLVLGLLVGAPLLAGAVLLGPTPLGLTLLALGGLTLLSASAIELVLMQELLPENRSSAVGLTYFMKAAGSIVATITLGALGDLFGLRAALLTGVAIGSTALPFTVAIRHGRGAGPAHGV